MIIKSDVFDICKRIKLIDKDYLLNWNAFKKRYEVVRIVNNKKILEVVVPYKSLDARLIGLLHRSSIRNYNKIMRDCNRMNALIKEQDYLNQKYQLNYDINLLLN